MNIVFGREGVLGEVLEKSGKRMAVAFDVVGVDVETVDQDFPALWLIKTAEKLD